MKRVEIPKPDGGVSKLGIPTVLDRLIQQAVMQVLQSRWDAEFSEHSYGFRPGRSAHQAVAKAQQYIAEGRRWVVDLDLEKFFDRVNHDKLMASIARRVADKRMLKLIRAFLTAGVMENGLVGSVRRVRRKAVPSHRCCRILCSTNSTGSWSGGDTVLRYADDCNIYVRSQRAGERVKAEYDGFHRSGGSNSRSTKEERSGRPVERKFLGFSFTANEPEATHRPQRLLRFKRKCGNLRAGPGESVWSR